MAKRKPKKSRAVKKRPVTHRHKTVALKGLTPREVEAYRQQEIRERAREAKKRDEELRQSGQKPGRPKGKKRLYREAASKQRKSEVQSQKLERRRRALRHGARAGAYSKTPKNVPQHSRSLRAGIEKTVTRVRGTASWQSVVDAFNALPSGTSAYVQLGTGYGKASKWVGSRLTTPAEAAGWLEGIGLKYTSKIFGGTKPQDLFIETVSYRKVKRGSKVQRRNRTSAPSRKARAAQPKRKGKARPRRGSK